MFSHMSFLPRAHEPEITDFGHLNHDSGDFALSLTDFERFSTVLNDFEVNLALFYYILI